VEVRTDGRLLRGDQTRRTVLRRAVEIASIDGLDGLSIGRLAKDLGISKSGIFAHFGSKEALELSTVRAARRIYADAVVVPALAVPPGLGRLWALSENWLDYSRRRVFPGGCFFAKAAHEYGGRPGAVHDLVAAASREWLDLLAQTVEEAKAVGEVRAETDSAQLAFELNSFYDSANVRSLLRDDADIYGLARAAAQARLQAVAAPGAPLPWASTSPAAGVTGH
jgi:AcrR family transcriptional regulator